MSQHAITDAPPQRRLFTRAEYERAAELGLFGPEERLELIGGQMIKRATPPTSPSRRSRRPARRSAWQT